MSSREEMRSVILRLGRPFFGWPLPNDDCLPVAECFDVHDELVEYGLLEYHPKGGYRLTDNGQAIYDRLVTGQSVPEEWWEGR